MGIISGYVLIFCIGGVLGSFAGYLCSVDFLTMGFFSGRLFQGLSVWEGSGCEMGWREVMTRKSTVKRVALCGQARCFFSFGIARVACYEGMGNWALDRDVFVLLLCN